MSIKYAILGLLSWQPATGYELKKVFEESSMMYWSGNNNQIYKALLQLQEESLVTSQVVHQDSSPAKKIYTITQEGLQALKVWILTSPEAPEFKKPFLVQLAWSDLLTDQELSDLLSKYEREVRIQLLMEQEKTRRALHIPNRNTREKLLWDMISENLISSFKNELNWICELRQKLFENVIIEEKSRMNYQIVETDNKKYIELISVAVPLHTERDALDLVCLCFENDIYLLMLHYDTLSEDFFRLKTKVAGDILQKLVNYGIKTAAVIPDEIIQKGRFREMALEVNKGQHFRMYESKEEAEKWLTE
jgi:PadR family transcriptional regulator AphA